MARFFTNYRPFSEEEDALALLGADLAPPVPVDEPEIAEVAPVSPVDDMAPVSPSAVLPQPASVSNGQPAEDDASPLEALGQRIAAPAAQPTRMAPRLPAPPTAEGIPTWSLLGAGIADLLLNKGRNAGNFIATLGTQDDALEMENYQRQVDHAKAQGDLDKAYAQAGGRGRGLSPEQIALQQARLGQGALRLKLQQGEAQRKAAESAQKRKQWEELNSVGSDRHKAMVTWAQQNGAPPGIEKLPVVDIQKIFPAINEYLKNTGEIADARTAQAAAEAAATGEAAMPSRIATARGIAEATQPFELEKIRAAESAKVEGARAAQANTVVPGFVVDNQAAFQQIASDPTSLRKLQADVDSFRGLLSALDRMEALRQQHGVELQSGEGSEYGTAKTTAIGALTQLAASGVLNEGEFQRYTKMIPDIELTWTDAAMLGGKDITLEKLQGVKRALEGTVQDKLYSRGGRLDLDSLPMRQKKKPAGKGKAKPKAAAPAPVTIDTSGSEWEDE